MSRIALRILEATVGIDTNNDTLLPRLPFGIEVKSPLTDFHRVEQVPYSDNCDGYIHIQDSADEPHYEWRGRNFVFTGPFEELSRNASDARFSFWGNQGFLYRYALYLLEKYHKIYNLHACALFDDTREILYLIIGGAGSGKTVYLLSGLAKGMRLFSTETVHFRLEREQIVWFKGSLVDNVRYGTLVHDFPQFLPDGARPAADNLWQEKTALDLTAFATDFDSHKGSKAVHIFFPHIEEGRKGYIQNTISDDRKTVKFLFDNISEKMSETTVLYDRLPVLGFDDKDLAKQRLDSVYRCVRHPSIRQIVSILSNPKDCWGTFLVRS
jgi:hypothetical protein